MRDNMPDIDKRRVLSLRESAWYMGCSPALLLKLSRAGWIKPREKVAYTNCNWHRAKCTFYLWHLEVLAWDFAISLSSYEIAKIICSKHDAAVTQVARGIPKRVVEIVRAHEYFTLVAELVFAHGPERSLTQYWGKVIESPPSVKLATLKMRELLKRDSVNSRRARANPSEKFSWQDDGAPRCFDTQPFDHIYGSKGVAYRKTFAGDSKLQEFRKIQEDQ